MPSLLTHEDKFKFEHYEDIDKKTCMDQTATVKLQFLQLSYMFELLGEACFEAVIQGWPIKKNY